jgi:hypothetical protein
MSENEPKHIPSANEFSPGQVILRKVLLLVQENAGNYEAILEAIRREYFSQAAGKRSDPKERLKQQRTRANNVLIGLKEYGLYDRQNYGLTPFGETLLGRGDDETMHEAFAIHIIRDYHGLEIINAVREMQLRHDQVTKESLHKELARAGFQLSTATTDHTTLLNWLGKARLFEETGKYLINPAVFRRLSGIDHSTIDEIASLSMEQKSFLKSLRTLAVVHGTEPIPVQDVFENAKRQSGSIFKEDQISARVIKPLAEQGWLNRELKSGGRGGKSGIVAATTKLLELDIQFLVPRFYEGIPSDLRGRLRTPLNVIYEDLKADDTVRKGLALELLSLRLLIDLGLIPVGFRERSKDTGGAEVDVVAEGVHLHFSRWSVQCKNTETPVTLASLAKEVGMAVILRGQVVLMVTTGRFARSVEEYARQVAETTNLQVVLVDKNVLRQYRDSGIGALTEYFHERAKEVMQLKRQQTSAAVPIS